MKLQGHKVVPSVQTNSNLASQNHEETRTDRPTINLPQKTIKWIQIYLETPIVDIKRSERGKRKEIENVLAQFQERKNKLRKNVFFSRRQTLVEDREGEVS